MRLTQSLQCKRRGERPRIPYFQSVGKQHHLDTAIAGIVAMGHRVDNRFGHDFAGDFVLDRNLRTRFSRPHPKIDLGQYKIHGLIHQVKDGSLIHLIGGNRLGDFDAMKMGAFHFRRNQKALRLPAEQQHSGVRRRPFVQQIQVGQQFRRLNLRRQGKSPGVAGLSHKTRQPRLVQISQRRILAGGSIKGHRANQLTILQILHQRRIDGGNQFGRTGKTAAYQLAFRLPDQFLHLGMTAAVAPLDENQPKLV